MLTSETETQSPTAPIAAPIAVVDLDAKAIARARGERLGFTGMFLAGFIERELILMEKWRNAKALAADTTPKQISGYAPWVRP